jgi:hypothetical protein
MTDQIEFLIEFLAARIADDKARALAWCEARQRILDDASPWVRENARRQGQNADIRVVAEEYERMLRALALPDAHHKDYQQEWKP